MRRFLVLLPLVACAEPTESLLLDCDPRDPCCSELVLSEEECGDEPTSPDGWNAPAGSGAAFILNSVRIAPCDGGDCTGNALGPIGELMNDTLRQGLLGGDTMAMVEISGLVADYRGWDRSVTVNIYAVRDADDPFFPANNFDVPAGHTKCCEFLINARWLSSDGRPLARMAGRIRDGRLEAVATGPIPLALSVGAPSHEALTFERVRFSAEVPPGLEELRSGSFDGVLRVSNMAEISNPYCRTVSPICPGAVPESSFVDLFTMFDVVPDVDLDGDGVACVFDDGGDLLVDRCCARCDGLACIGPEIPPADASRLSTCSELVEDGYSARLEVTAVDATIVGIALR